MLYLQRVKSEKNLVVVDEVEIEPATFNPRNEHPQLTYPGLFSRDACFRA
jgi:hypothetical protein